MKTVYFVLLMFAALMTACTPASTTPGAPTNLISSFFPTQTPAATATPAPTSTPAATPTPTPLPTPLGKWLKVQGSLLLDQLTFYEDGTVVAMVPIVGSVAGKYSYLNSSHTSMRLDNIDPRGPLIFDLRYAAPDQLELLHNDGTRTLYLKVKPTPVSLGRQASMAWYHHARVRIVAI